MAAKIAGESPSMSRARTLEMTPTAEATPITNSEVGMRLRQGEPESVHEDRDSEDRSTASEETEQDSDGVRPSASARVNVINCALHPDCRACPGRLGVWWWPRPRHLTVLVRPSLGP